ncbi:hypothetical protein [Salinimicrobium sp. HB62]|uniref:hypothetical protein n=1 Tax=Salinimicrobium sp. HB62 TaxID=3077781 RepID=UPI002D7655C9|nr:hypothetical protein [Salinimicrobium sp. HB62]
MSSKKIFWIIGVVAGLILLMFLTNFFVKQKIEQALDERFQSSAYEDLSVNIFLNKFSIEDVKIDLERLSINAEKISASGISYSKYLFSNKIDLDELEFTSPEVDFFPADSAKEKSSGKDREVLIRSISVQDGRLSKKASDTASASFFAHIPRAVVKNVSPGMELSGLKDYSIDLDTVYLKMNSEHYIDVGKFSAKNGQVDISSFRIRSFYPRSQFDRVIPFEKDQITLDVKGISLDSLLLKRRKDSLYLTNPKMTVTNANLTIYRNKLLKDDATTKPLYSKMLRELPFYLNFDLVQVENSEIIYEEQVKEEGGPGIVRFAGINGEIKNLHNIKELEDQPKITANADFMRGTPVSIDWTFPVFDPQDRFHISGRFGHLEGEALDPFLVPSLDVQARGTLNEVYFNFYGNDEVLRGDFRMDYEDFKIELLNKKYNKKGFFSAIANLFVDNEQEPDEGGGQDVRVERTKNRSFWNYVWKGLREGLIDAVGQL